MRTAVTWFGVVALALTACMSGCRTFQGQCGKAAVMRGGLPDPRWHVGGGVCIDFTAPEEGIVYVVDLHSNRFLVTDSVEEGDFFSFQPDDEATLHMLGIDLAKAEIALYFVPATALSETPEEED